MASSCSKLNDICKKQCQNDFVSFLINGAWEHWVLVNILPQILLDDVTDSLKIAYLKICKYSRNIMLLLWDFLPCLLANIFCVNFHKSTIIIPEKIQNFIMQSSKLSVTSPRQTTNVFYNSIVYLTLITHFVGQPHILWSAFSEVE